MDCTAATILAMDLTPSDVISWLITGALAGSLVGRLLKGRKKGSGLFQNILLGCGGALLGFLVFGLFDVTLGLQDIKITADHLVGAVAGTIALMVILKFAGKKDKAA